jgi:multidrug efflux pump subunit AcrA (membrane-fusion protein)
MSLEIHTDEEENPDIRYSDETIEIMSDPPNWIMRWGISVYFLALGILLVISSIIKYPELVNAQLRITTANAAKAIIPKVTGKAFKILVKENQVVKKDQPLIFLESTGDHQEVLNLIRKLKSLQALKAASVTALKEILVDQSVHKYGELQLYVEIFSKNYLSYLATLDNGLNRRRKSIIKNELYHLEEHEKLLIKQKELLLKDLKIAEDDYLMHQKLTKDQAETAAELRVSESNLLTKRNSLLQLDRNMLTERNTYMEKEREGLEINNELTEQRIKFTEALNSLISQAEDWKNRFILSAPNTGKVNFVDQIQENKILEEGKVALYINPHDKEYLGEIAIGQHDIGRIRPNMDVIIKLQGYPFEEYGVVKGLINNISNVPREDGSFLAMVRITGVENNSNNSQVELKEGMLADAQIITRNVSVFKRITNRIIKAVDAR